MKTIMAYPNEFSTAFENGEYDVVYVEMPEIELDEDNKVILGKHTLVSSEKEGVYEVPQAVAEETIEYYCHEDFQNTPYGAATQTDPLAIIDEHNDDAPHYMFSKPNSTDKAKIKVKTLESLVRNSISPDSVKSSNRHDEIVSYQSIERIKSRDRRKQVFPKWEDEKPILTATTTLKTPPKDMDTHQAKDLMWLLNFKFDNFLKENPLDAQPTNADDQKSVPATKHEKLGSKCHESADDQEEEETLKKPPFTYTELIECALVEKGPLTVSELYQWISDMFPYYKAWDDRWKNSVRHNLSINPYFRKGGKAKQGAGHLWTVSESAETARSLSAKRQRYEEFEAYTKRMKLNKSIKRPETMKTDADADAREAEIAASIIYNIIEDKENQCQKEIKRRNADDVLNDVKVVIEYIEPISNVAGNDFLNPVSKEDLMGECGFFNEIELSMTAETSEHFEAPEIESSFEQLDDLGLQFNDLNCNMAAQPLVN